MQQRLDGRYEILKPLSSGGFGKTYLARDLRIPGTPYCVVKQLHCISHDPKDIQLAQQLFQREAESLAKLGHHDQIPRLLAYFTEKEEFYLVEDYIEGRSLEDEIKSGQPWSEAVVIDLVQGMLDVLAYVHSQGVIHRDIKPGNLIRRQSDGKIVLIDFGAIKQIEQVHPGQAHRTGTQIGTAGYMPPEQAQGKPRPNSDLYGIGIVGISALTGHPAIGLADDPQTGEIVWQHLAPVSPGFAQILNRMVRYHFQHRYQTVEEVQRDLASLSSNAAIPGKSHPVTESVPTQVASPAASQSNPSPTTPPVSSQPQKTKGPSWLLGISLAIFIPILGGAASLFFNQRAISTNRASSSTTDSATTGPCKAVVNGNIRSERTAYFGSQNVLQTGQGNSFEIGSKETRGGWIEIKLQSGQTAWTHLDVVSNESTLKRCLNQKNIALQTISDIPPPARPTPPPTPAPQPSASPDEKPDTPEDPKPGETSDSPNSEADDNPAESSSSTDGPETPTENSRPLEIEETQAPPIEAIEDIESSTPGPLNTGDRRSSESNTQSPNLIETPETE